MFQIDLHAKRTRLAIRFFTYGVMTVATIVISTLALFLALGYSFDNKDLSFEQGGLLQFRSFPEGAAVSLNGKQLAERTPSKSTVEVGQHEIIMKLTGYHDWRKAVTIKAGQLLWLNYSRFIPQDLKSDAVRQFDTLHGSLTSPNRQFMAIQPLPDQPHFVIADIRNEEDPKFTDYTVPAASITPKPDAPNMYSIEEWNLGGRYLLIRHTAGDLNELIRLDRDRPAEAINITVKYGVIGEAHFAGNNANQLIGLLGTELRRFDIPGTTSDLLAEGIKSFTLYKGNLIGFISERNGTRQVGVLEDGREAIVRTYPLDVVPQIDISNYFNNNYLAIAIGNVVEVIRNPQDANNSVPRIVERFEANAETVQWLYFSNSGRMIVAQNQGKFTTHDLELDKESVHELTVASPLNKPFEWLDDYYLWVDADNNLRFIEYDGNNEHSIGSVLAGHTVSLSEDNRALFSFDKSKTNNKYDLKRTGMVVE